MHQYRYITQNPAMSSSNVPDLTITEVRPPFFLDGFGSSPTSTKRSGLQPGPCGWRTSPSRPPTSIGSVPSRPSAGHPRIHKSKTAGSS